MQSIIKTYHLIVSFYNDLGEKGIGDENLIPFFHPQTIIVKQYRIK